MSDAGPKYRTVADDDAVVVAVDTAAAVLLALADRPAWTDAERERLAVVAADMVASAHRSRPAASGADLLATA